MAGSRRRFDRAFKVEAVRLVTERGHSLNQVARDLDVRPDLLRRWKRQLEEEGERAFPGEGRSRDEELAQLRRDLRRVTEERDIEKSGGDRLGAPAVRFRFIDRHREQFSVSAMCRTLEVSSSGYYAWCARPESTRCREDRRLRVKIRAAHERSHRSYGSPRIHAHLQAEGERCGRRRVARLMREEGLAGKKRRRYRSTTDSRHAGAVAPNLLEQKFQVERPDTAWGGDITYLRTREGWLYLAVLLDLCSRFVVGWALSSRLDQELTLQALERAVAQRQPGPGILHHSDRGCQYTAAQYRERLAKLGMRASMSRKGNCWDNAPLESFFDSLKTELGEETFETRAAARAAVFDYIERFYNRQRLHSALGYVSPAAFERAAA